MFELSSETRVNELQPESEAMMAALKGTGIFRDGDDLEVTIGDLCWNVGLNPLIILNTLVRARASEEPSNIDVSELDGLTLSQVVDNIESVHHAYLREALPKIQVLIDRVVQAHGANDERLTEAHALFRKISEDLENHMLHEEEALFPMVRDMETEGAIKPTRCGDKVGGPIACMENDHKLAKEELAQLRALTDDFAVPGYACMTYRNLLEQLRDFEQNTVVHIHKEDKVLFPGAVKAQGALRERNA
jgi:regulator of cell morphogenesis and NO signaling